MRKLIGFNIEKGFNYLIGNNPESNSYLLFQNYLLQETQNFNFEKLYPSVDIMIFENTN